MIDCPSCGNANTPGSRQCSQCGAPLSESTPLEGATVVQGASSPATPRSRLTESAASGLGGERFAPGAVLLERYRILSQVGRGGMGEVYRAEDLTLGQTVALKFLPQDFGRDETRRQRFLQEAKLARQIAHPNVCRVYDVGEFRGDLFLSMEFIEGRDLSSVLRSIGRLPEEKALDIARQLCAGLAALHELDLLHRDLKPANVMLDDRGRVRITDFGLTGISDQIRGSEIRSGTPQYMAPEQLDGREVTRRSDIYSLGLVLYEVFSGQAAIQGDSLEAIADAQRTYVPSHLNSHVSTIDPAVDRVVARCLEKDPQLRPDSALVVSLALPGGDPLAAALAMGETPSPELVAAAGGRGGIHPVLGIGLVLLGLLGLLREAGAFGPSNLLHYFDMTESADGLQVRARDLLEDIGYAEEPVDRTRGFARAGTLLRWVAEQDSSVHRWDHLGTMRPSPMLFWYRQSPDYFVPDEPNQSLSYSHPPMDVSGMARVTLDLDGHLIYFSVVPLEYSSSDSVAIASGNYDTVPEERWDRLFEAAGLDRKEFAATAPEWIPDEFAMRRFAWAGTIASEGSSHEVRVEAGSVDDRPVYFQLRGPWSEDGRTVTTPRKEDRAELFVLMVVIAVLLTGTLLAVRHYRSRRADVQGAGRLAVFVLLLSPIGWLFRSHHVPLANVGMDHFFGFLAIGAMFGVICFMLYLALEPFVRRSWPQVLIGSTRLLSGSWKDPLVGRSVLFGAGMFGAGQLLGVLADALRRALQLPPPMPDSPPYLALASSRFVIANLAGQIPTALFNALFFLMLLVFLRLVLRRKWLAYVLFGLFTGFLLGSNEGSWQVGAALGLPLAILWTVVLVRLGVLAFVAGILFSSLVGGIPLTLDPSQSYISTSVAAILAVTAWLVWALVTALAGRSLLGEAGPERPGAPS